MSSLPLRALREDDAEAVAALFVGAFGDARKLDAEEIRTWIRNSRLQDDWLRVLEVGGRVVGYGDIWPEAEVLDVDVAAPGNWDVFFEWAESEARERDIPCVRTQVPHGHALAEVVAARGYEPWRFSYTMEIELSEPPPAPVPDGIELRPYDGGEAELVRAALNEAFADDPLWGGLDAESFAEFYLGARGFDPSLWLLAWDGGSLAGCSLAYPLRGHDSGLGWIGTLAVLPPWRRRGIGRALLLSSFAALYDRGLRRVGLGVDSQNATGALRLYEGVGMRKVRQSDNWRRAL